MRLLLDSHVFVWIKSAPHELSDAARAAIMDPENQAFVSIAGAWELWVKHAKKPFVAFARVLDGGAATFSRAASDSDIVLLGLTLEHAAKVRDLPLHHRDPFDRLMIAQALHEGLTLVTRDDAFDKYDGLRTLKT
jgi:PIN domain nuclease of toxin-antitoxin system